MFAYVSRRMTCRFGFAKSAAIEWIRPRQRSPARPATLGPFPGASIGPSAFNRGYFLKDSAPLAFAGANSFARTLPKRSLVLFSPPPALIERAGATYPSPQLESFWLRSPPSRIWSSTHPHHLVRVPSAQLIQNRLNFKWICGHNSGLESASSLFLRVKLPNHSSPSFLYLAMSYQRNERQTVSFV